MYFTPTPPDLSPLNRVTREALDVYFLTQGQGFNPYTMRRQAMDELKRLDALSLGELRALGLTREDIPAYVFGRFFAN